MPCLLATVAPALVGRRAARRCCSAAALIASPFLVLAQQPGSAPVALAFGQASTVAQAVPYAIGGLAAAAPAALPGDAAGGRVGGRRAGAADQRAGR